MEQDSQFIRPEQNPLFCGYCHDDIVEGQPLTQDSKRLLYHKPCYDEKNGVTLWTKLGRSAVGKPFVAAYDKITELEKKHPVVVPIAAGIAAAVLTGSIFYASNNMPSLEKRVETHAGTQNSQ